MKFLSTLVMLAILSVFTEALHHEHEHARQPAHRNRMIRRVNNGTLRRRQNPVCIR